MKNLIKVSLCLLGLLSGNALAQVSNPSNSWFGVFAWDSGTLNPRFLEYGNADYEVVDMASFGYEGYGSTIPKATNNIDIANYKNQKCADMNGGSALVWSSYDGSDMFADVTPDSIVSYARLNSVNCRKIQIAPGRTVFFSDGYYNTGGQNLSAGGQVSDPAYFYNSGTYKTFCEAQTAIPDGTADIYNSMCYGIDPNSGDECEKSAGFTWQVNENFLTQDLSNGSCISGCQATRSNSSLTLTILNPAQTFTLFQTNGQSCDGAEHVFDDVQFTENGLQEYCENHFGSNYCLDFETGGMTLNGTVVWNFNNGDYYDGVCSITGYGSFVCGADTLQEGVDTDDPLTQFAVDTDDDLVPDSYFVQETANGLARIVPGSRLDTNGDGTTDSVAIDSNRDGLSDSIANDENQDGRADLDNPDTPNVDESQPKYTTGAQPRGERYDGSIGECLDNLNTPWNECDTDGDGEGGQTGSPGGCTDDTNTPWNDCTVGVSALGCDSPPECLGDPVQCGAVYLQWKSACASYLPDEVLNSNAGLLEYVEGDDGSFLNEYLDVGLFETDAWLDVPRDFPPLTASFSVHAEANNVEFDLNPIRPLFVLAGNFLVIIVLLQAIKIVVRT